MALPSPSVFSFCWAFHHSSKQTLVSHPKQASKGIPWAAHLEIICYLFFVVMLSHLPLVSSPAPNRLQPPSLPRSPVTFLSLKDWFWVSSYLTTQLLIHLMPSLLNMFLPWSTHSLGFPLNLRGVPFSLGLLPASLFHPNFSCWHFPAWVLGHPGTPSPCVPSTAARVCDLHSGSLL